MAKYIDGFVLVVSKKKMKDYKELSQMAGKVWLDHGALEYRECIGEDMNVKFGLPFPKLAKTKKGETVVFSWIVYKSRRHRDQVNKRVMADQRMSEGCDPGNMPFDPKRMAYGGFEVFVDLQK